MAKPRTDGGDARRELLAAHFLFAELPPAELDRVLETARTLSLQRDEVIFRQGDPADRLYGILRGSVRAVTVTERGQELVLRLMPAGEVFGEVALFDGGVRSATVVANESCELLVIERAMLFPLLQTHPALALHLLAAVSRRLRALTESLEDALFLGLPARLAKKLIELLRSHGRERGQGIEIGLQLSQHGLGTLIGISRESINKQIRAWEKSGLLRMERGVLTVLDREHLEKIARGDEL